jgi:predicted membrane-bound spermidine synthase
VSVESPAAEIAAIRPDNAASSRVAHFGLVLLFLVSGAAALIYQVCWQRLLFESVGTDIDSVTIIVSTFMLGLGLGALAGGEIVDRYPQRALELFALIELATGVFGFFSPWLIRAMAAATVKGSLATIAVANFGLLLIPTTLMGATLPILVTHVMRAYRNLGVSVGTLYCANTLGAALGAALTGFVVLYYCGLMSTIYIAAALNVVVSTGVWSFLREKRV